MFGLGKKEKRATVTQSTGDHKLLQMFGLVGAASGSGQIVTNESALGVPAVFAAVNFISGTIAGLPLHLYQRTKDGRKRQSGVIANLLHDAVSDEETSFEWRKYTFDNVLTGGRGLTQIVRNGRGEVAKLVPMEPKKTTIKMISGSRFYQYQDGDRKIRLEAVDVIDIPFMLKEDRVGHYGPIATNREAIGLAQAVQSYAGRFFENGGVPPFAVTGNFQSGNSMKRAADDLESAVNTAAAEGRQALILPAGLDIKPIGSAPDKNQLLETQRFIVEQIARIYSLPPTFLQDLTHGTFSNTEQQDLHFVKHTLKRWIEQFEQELNLKLFGRGKNKFFVEFNVDGLLRGDFKTRMEGHATSIQNSISTPNEVRALENKPPLNGGDELMIQGATVPLKGQEKTQEGDDDGA